MSRQPRLVLPGIALHVIQRGNNRVTCFGADSDYLCYLTNLRKLSAKHGCTVHAYCLMTNHVHLLLTPADTDSCRNLMQNLGQCYVQYFNRRHGRSGTLWEGRYRSCVVESARYVLACYRYIELNPVRAGMVSCPRDHLWSSHAANCGFANDVLAAPHPEYLALADNPCRRGQAYRRMFDEALDNSLVASIRDATQASLPLTGDCFRAALLAEGRKVKRERPGPHPNKSEETEERRQLKIVL